MQSAETVLGVLRERGRRHLPCRELYRQLFNPQLYLLAYARIYAILLFVPSTRCSFPESSQSVSTRRRLLLHRSPYL